MPRDFFPRREADIFNFTRNFSEKINLDPLAYGLSPLQASLYSQLQLAFAQAFRIVNDNSTNASSAYAARDSARIALERMTRQLANIIRGMSVTDAMRIGLGLPARPTRRQRIPAPTIAPLVQIVGTIGRSVRIELLDAESNRRKRARDAGGAYLYGFVGADYPANLKGYDFKGSTSSARATVKFDTALPPGTLVWVAARWTNRRGAGPLSTPRCVHLAGDVVIEKRNVQRATARHAA
jgi:hypothetical protein